MAKTANNILIIKAPCKIKLKQLTHLRIVFYKNSILQSIFFLRDRYVPHNKKLRKKNYVFNLKRMRKKNIKIKTRKNKSCLKKGDDMCEQVISFFDTDKLDEMDINITANCFQHCCCKFCPRCMGTFDVPLNHMRLCHHQKSYG